jgi:hypothetical protein
LNEIGRSEKNFLNCKEFRKATAKKEMKQTAHFLLAFFFVSVSSNVFADSLVINYSNNKRLYKWDGTHIINYSNNKRLVKIDGLMPIPILIVLVVGLL